MFKKFNLISLLLVLFTLLSPIIIFAEESNVVTKGVILSRFEKYDKQNIGRSKLASTTEGDGAYSAIKNGIIDVDNTIDITSFQLNGAQLKNLLTKILVENPDIFYVNGWSYSYNPSSGIATALTPDYDYNKSTIINMRGEIDSKVNQILNATITNDMTDFQKELAIHDYLILNSKYDTNKYSDGSYAKESHSIYGILVKGIGVCESYAESFKLLLNKVGIESMVVISTPAMNHAWNMVNLDGKYYHVDVTWDDPTPDREGITSYRYLNLTDSKIGSDHFWDNDNYPACTSDDYSYLWDMSSPIVKDNYIYYSLDQNNSEYIYRLDQSTLTKQQITTDRAPYFAIAGDWIYYSNYSNGAYLCKINVDGSGKQQLNSIASIDIFSKDNRIYYTEENTNNKKYIELEAQPTVAVESVAINNSTLALIEGNASKLIATISPSNATNKNISWTSNNTSVATVDGQGNVIAVAEGSATITATTEDGSFVSTCTINVTAIEVEDDYTGYIKWEEKLDVSATKEWTIRFNQSIMEGSINNNIYITDIAGNLFATTSLQLSDDKTITIKPNGNYTSGSAYYLYIENLKSQTGKKLLNNVKMKFTVK